MKTQTLLFAVIISMIGGVAGSSICYFNNYNFHYTFFILIVSIIPICIEIFSKFPHTLYMVPIYGFICLSQTFICEMTGTIYPFVLFNLCFVIYSLYVGYQLICPEKQIRNALDEYNHKMDIHVNKLQSDTDKLADFVAQLKEDSTNDNGTINNTK